MSSYRSFKHGWRRHFKPYGALLAGIAAFTVAVPSSASQLKYIPSRVGFIVEDPHTHHALPNSEVTLTEVNDPKAAMSLASPTPTVDLHSWKQLPVRQPLMQIALVPGQQMVLRISPVPSGLPPGGPPIKDIYIVVRASLLDRSVATPAQVTSHAQIEQSGVAVGGSVNALVQHDAGVATDSSGQQHVRGEHAEEAYVIDGVPLPDTLSGRQGSILSLDTVESVQFLTGSYPPEYGGQTAAVLDITTLPAARHFTGDLSLQGGSYSTTNGDLTLQGPIGKKAGYVLDLTATRTDNIDDPQQPSPQTTNNAGASVSEFAKVRYKPASSDTITFTMDNAPNTAQLSNRSGLPSSFVNSGQGYGFLGLRDQNGIVPPAVQLNPGGLGSSPLFLPSQVADGMDITQREQNEYAVLEWQHRFKHRARSVFAVTLLHSGQEVNNNNPAVNILSLPLDNSIEYNPTVARNVHHVQFVGSLTLPEPKHRIKAGFILDDQSGNESYNLIPASQLALDALYGSAPNLAPPGSVVMQAGANGASSPQLDVNGYAVYHATGQSPTVHVHRSGFYRAAYIQDTWQESHRLTINYGLRYDWYYQGQNLGQPVVDGSFLSPRYNFAYTPDRLTSIRFSADKLFNYPPIAQGSVVGAPIQPETLWQYDFSIQRQIARGQTVHLAYYIKDIKNQVDTGLLIPGSPIGLYSAVNFSHGGVHGIEFEYDDTPPSGHGFNNFVNYTYSIAAPAGVTNTGQISPQFNDHDERNTIGIGSAYTWKNEADASLVYSYGSGLASSVVVPSVFRSPNTEYDLHFSTGKHFLGKAGQLQLDIMNLFNERSVVNFESGFSGTRFQQGRRIYLSIVSHF